MSVRTVRAEIRTALKTAKPAEESRLTRAEAIRIVLEAAKGPVTSGELSQVKELLRKGGTGAYRLDANAKSLLSAFVRKHEGAGQLKPATVPTSIAANMASAAVESEIWINRMPGPGPASKTAHATVNIVGAGFADAPPDFAVKSIDVYEKGTNKKVATVANPKPVSSDIMWGQKTQTYSVAIPEAKLDMNKTYTFVANTGINGAKPQLVRSEYVPVGQAF